MLVFVEGCKPENPDKNPRSKARTNNKLNPDEAASTRIEPGSEVGGDRLSTTLLSATRIVYGGEKYFMVTIHYSFKQKTAPASLRVQWPFLPCSLSFQ